MSIPDLKYPYEWGRNPVNNFVEKYPRGTYILAKLWDVPPGIVRHTLIRSLCKGNSLRYEAFKRVIKALDQYEMDDIKRISETYHQALYRLTEILAEDDVIDGEMYRKGLDTFR